MAAMDSSTTNSYVDNNNNNNNNNNNDASIKCNSCMVEFPWNFRTEHYRSDWHRYNVKRKCANLPPIPQQLFENKLNSSLQRKLAEQAHEKYQKNFSSFVEDEEEEEDEQDVGVVVGENSNDGLMRKYVVLPGSIKNGGSGSGGDRKVSERQQQQQGRLGGGGDGRVFSGNLLKYRCKLCKKDFKTRQQCQSHLNTRKHATVFYDYQQMLYEMSSSRTASLIPGQLLAAHSQSSSHQDCPNDNDNHNNSTTTTTPTNTNTNTVQQSGEESFSDVSSIFSHPSQLHRKRMGVNRRQLVVNTDIENNECVEIIPVQKNKSMADRQQQQQQLTMIEPGEIASSSEKNKMEANANSNEPERNDADVLDPTRCLFCTQHGFEDFTQNLEHMERAHGFFIPLPHKLVSQEALFSDVLEIIGKEHQCTWCWHKFKSLRAVQTHMRHVGHCKLNLDHGPAVYDTTAINSDESDDQEKLDMIEEGESIFIRHYDWNKHNSDPTDIVQNSQDNQIIAYDKEPKIVVNMNEINELVRRDGTVIGHRDFAVLYKQKPRDHLHHKSNEQVIAEVNNPNKKFQLGETIEQVKQQKEHKKDSIQQLKKFKKHKEDSNIGLNMRAHKLHLEQFKTQNQMLY